MGGLYCEVHTNNQIELKKKFIQRWVWWLALWFVDSVNKGQNCAVLKHKTA